MTYHRLHGAPCSNPTDYAPQQLRKRRAYLAAHMPYVDYLRLILDRASLPNSTSAQPNVTNIAAMAHELQGMNPRVVGLNAVVLGRFLHRILYPLLTWHGGYHALGKGHCGADIFQETTVYRLPEIGRSRAAFADFTETANRWSNDHDQWQWPNRGEEWE